MVISLHSIPCLRHVEGELLLAAAQHVAVGMREGLQAPWARQVRISALRFGSMAGQGPSGLQC